MKRKLSSLKPNECIHIRTEKEAKKIFKQLRVMFPEYQYDVWEHIFKTSLITLPNFCFVTDMGYGTSKEGIKTRPNKIPASYFIKTKSKIKKRLKALEDAVFTTAKTELTELPEKWCVAITKENITTLLDYLNPTVRPKVYLQNNPFITESDWTYGKPNGYTEISFADFKRLVLKEQQYPKIEFNKWYKSDSGDCIAFITGHENDTDFYTAYGINEGKWFEDGVNCRS